MSRSESLVRNGAPLLNHTGRPIPADGEALIEEYNAELVRLEEHGQNTWFTAPWLYAE
jgi:hypothetical protein